MESLYYAEFRSGYCIMAECADLEEAQDTAQGFADAYRTRVTKVRLATTDDQTNFRGAIYR